MKLRFGIRQKIMLPVLAISVISYAVTFGYVSFKIYNKSISDVKLAVNSYVTEKANLITIAISSKIENTELMAKILEINPQYIKEQREKTDISILKSTFEKEKVLSVWLSRQLFSINKNWTQKYGRKRLTIYKDSFNIIKTDYVFLDKKGEDSSGMYHYIHENNVKLLVEPYKTALGKSEKEILMTSICIPVNNKSGEFIGLAGFDFSLEHLQKTVINFQNIKGSNAFLLSNSGIYLAHEEKDRIGTSIAKQKSETDEKFHIVDNIKKGSAFSFMTENTAKEDDSYFVTFAPVMLGNDINPWSIGIAVPLSKIVKEARRTIKNTIIVGSVGFLILIIIIFFIANSFSKLILKSVK